jgi:hypothetical protein
VVSGATTMQTPRRRAGAAPTMTQQDVSQPELVAFVTI